MADKKVKSSSAPGFAQGGPKDGMASRTGVNTQKPGCTAVNNHGMGGDWAKGGPADGMHRKSGSVTRAPGSTGGMPSGGR